VDEVSVGVWQPRGPPFTVTLEAEELNQLIRTRILQSPPLTKSCSQL
jgi:hypothetical protein